MSALGSTIVILGIAFFLISLAIYVPLTLWFSARLLKKLGIASSWKKNVIMNAIQIIVYQLGLMASFTYIQIYMYKEIAPIEAFLSIFVSAFMSTIIGIGIFKIFYKTTSANALKHAASIPGIMVLIHIIMSGILLLITMFGI